MTRSTSSTSTESNFPDKELIKTLAQEMCRIDKYPLIFGEETWKLYLDRARDYLINHYAWMHVTEDALSRIKNPDHAET